MNPEELSDNTNLVNAQLALESGNTEMAVRHILEYLVKKEPKAKDNPAHRPEPPVQQKRNVAKF